ncbi:WD repeat-containing protein 43-like [Macrobrachium nipponense]|uniref:WD repeat-containing protein 43-like n=1 Tax=Macrobrachium nipponense TaxID=159736 RepID=UPI0030C7A488
MTKSKLVSFTPDGGKLAHSGPDGVLRIWDTTSGALEHEYQPAEHLKATTSCIRYSPKAGKKKDSHSLLAMGTLAGTILLYSPEESEVKATFEHSSHQAVMDVAWFSSDRLVSLGRDNTIIIWDIETGKKDVFDKVCEGTAICLFGKKMVAIGNRKIQVVVRQDSGKVKVKNNFTGHLSPVTQLLKIRMKEKTGGQYFLSSSLDDRFIYAWSTSSSSDSPLCSFMVNDTVTNMAVGELSNNTVALSATTQKGALVLFTHHLNGNKGGKAVKSTGSLQICSMSDNKKSVIPIVASHFCNDSESSIIIVYNRSSIFTFERVSLEKIVGEQEFIRAEPSSGKGLSLLKTLTPTVPDDATLIGPLQSAPVQKGKAKRKRGDEDNVASLPMEERLNVLALDTSGTQGTSFSGTDDFAQLLLQGLHSKDQNILRNVFDRGDLKSINKTVRRLPVQAVVPLLEQLAVAIMGKGHKNANHVKWVRSVLYHHMSHLSTVPDRQELMQPFFNISAARMSTFSQVTQLHARLDLILTHVAARQQEVKQKDTEPEALLVYRDESSDEDDMLGYTMIGVSESEDNWDELSDIDQMNGPTDEESEMETDPQSGAVKRKLNDRAGKGEDSDDEDEEESVDGEIDEDDSKNAEDDDDGDYGDDEDDASENSDIDMNGDDDGGTDSDSEE